MSENFSEIKVFNALSKLTAPWRFFPSVEWRVLGRNGEVIGEMDVVIFHPQKGLVVFEVKGGAIRIEDGRWFYQNGLELKQSPFAQARRNRYALVEKLQAKLGKLLVEQLTITHAVWFPDVVWKGCLPTLEAPSLSFLFDHDALKNTEKALNQLFKEASNGSEVWSKVSQHALFDLLSPSQQQLVPLVVRIDEVNQHIKQATDQQLAILKMLRGQKRLLIDGVAGSGKTLLAATLAKEHAMQGKKVLFTCYNQNLAHHLGKLLKEYAQIMVKPFHELAKSLCQSTGIHYQPPTDGKEIAKFYQDESPELLLQASELCDVRFDTIIVDEAADFASTWWIGLEALGAVDFSWYCFYDHSQTIYQENWQPPFVVEPMLLEANLRNTQAIAKYAHSLTGQQRHFAEMSLSTISEGEAPTYMVSSSFDEMANQLKALLHDLIHVQSIKPEQIVVLSPFKHTNEASTWVNGLKSYSLNTNIVEPIEGQISVGTIQGFKGLESDVVILAGITRNANKNKQLLYVGATRARSLLYVLGLSN
jgi:hypothetical protein